jgi:Holliday junction resolvasome RuvABC DNA-binding subunit
MQPGSPTMFSIFSDESETKFIEAFFESKDEYMNYADELENRLQASFDMYSDISFCEEEFIEVDIDDAISALQALGYKKKDAQNAVDLAIGSGASTVEEVITFALGKSGTTSKVTYDEAVYNDSVDSLIVLGYKRKDIETLVADAMCSGIITTEDIIKYCLGKVKLL